LSLTNRVLIIDESDQSLPYVGRGNGIESQTLVDNWGPDRMFADYNLVGIKNHSLRAGSAYRSEEDPDAHGGGLEIFVCLYGNIVLYTRTPESLEKGTTVLSGGVTAFVAAGVQHWFEVTEESFLTTIFLQHKHYIGGTPWRPDAVITVNG
jgi:hypothetical protein